MENRTFCPPKIPLKLSAEIFTKIQPKSVDFYCKEQTNIFWTSVSSVLHPPNWIDSKYVHNRKIIQFGCDIDLRNHVRLFVRSRQKCPNCYFFKFQFCSFWPKTFQKSPFWPKMPKNEGFSHFFAILSLEFANFCTKPSIWSQKIRFHIFGKIKNWPFWPNLGHFLLKIWNIIYYILLLVLTLNFLYSFI